MSTLVVPALDAEPWPTLGPQVAHFIETFLPYGPGDLRGQPYHVTDEFRGQLYRAYEVTPVGMVREGRRRFNRVALSERKGTGKTEKAALIAACEAHPRAPVRFDHWAVEGEQSWWGYAYQPGEPVGRGVSDPYIPMVAYTQDQSEELAFGALLVVLGESELASDFDIGLERIIVLDSRGRAKGKVVPLAGSPNARDGARTTFEHFDETHRFTLESLRKAHRTMLANLPKRPMADPWALETTTTFTPGEGSVAESTMAYGEAVAEGRVTDSRLFFFHRQASDAHDLTTEEGRRAAVIEASGPASSWSDIDVIVSQWDEPDADLTYLERVWTNRSVQAARQAFDLVRWAELVNAGHVVPDRAHITLGFDGARFRDATGLIGTEVATGHQWVVGAWERPIGTDGKPAADWEVPEDEVDQAVSLAFEKWRVWRLYADPPYWEDTVDHWAGRWGEKRVVKWWTNQWKRMAYTLRAYRSAQEAAELSHDGSAVFARHMGNAMRRTLQMTDDEGKPLWVIEKDRSDSPNKIDLAMAGCLSWKARGDAVAAGVGRRQVAKPAEFVSY